MAFANNSYIFVTLNPFYTNSPVMRSFPHTHAIQPALSFTHSFWYLPHSISLIELKFASHYCTDSCDLWLDFYTFNGI